MAAILTEVPKVGRVMRRPSHTWHVRHKPYVIQPFMIAPVLPGETMKNLLLQSRAVTDPIKNPLIGWWLEYYVFYVKHRDLAGRADFVEMMLQPGYDLSSYNRATDVDTYHGGSGLDWTWECLKCVTDNYFRDEGEDYTDHQIDSMPIAKINNQSWIDSLIKETDAQSGEGSETASSADTASDLDDLRIQWEHLRAMNMTTMDYEDYLRTFGVRTQAEEHHRPELIRFIRDWAYPANTVDPTDGSVTSAVSWATSERADKDRFFKEPGFVFGVTVARPKVYLSKQTSAAVSMMTDALSWLPAIMRDEPATSLKQLATGAEPFGGSTQAMWCDIRDLFLYGDQFINYALTDAASNMAALPAVAGTNNFYVSETDTDGLFNSATVDNIDQDGIVSMKILGTQVDQTPTMSGVI